MIDKKLMPFDLERALAGDKLIYRNGEPVTVFHYLKNRDITEKICMTVCMNGSLTVHYSNGRICEDQEFPLDLFMAPKVKTLWFNLYKDKNGYTFKNNSLHATKEIAEDHIIKGIGYDYINTFSIEVEE